MLPEENTLVLTVGLPRSGKSTWSRHQINVQSSIAVVNPDSIRLALHGRPYVPNAEDFVWAIARNMTVALFLAGHRTVILDATSLTENVRARWVQPSKWRTCFKVFATTKDVCIERAKKDKRLDLIPVIEAMSERIDFPTSDLYMPETGM